MRNFFTCCLMVIALLSFSDSFAQENITVTGKVTDSLDGLGIPGVSVLVKGTNQGTQTNAEGDYSISAPANATLVYSFVSYRRKEIPVDNQESINVVLSMMSEQLDQVVVIGYGTAAKRDLTGSITTIRGEDIADRPAMNPVANIQGRVAGVQITNSGRPGQQPDVRIRGTNSINGAAPLYVVDGILNDNIDFVNPADIESMEVLKDPSSLAIFGVRGANGVIAITTKQAKEGQINFNFNTNTGFKNVAHRMRLTDGNQFRMLFDEQRQNQGVAPYDYSLYNANTDWQDEIFQTGAITLNNLSVSGATEKNKFYMGLGYQFEEGMIKNEALSRINVTLNDQLEITDNFRVGINFTGYRAELPFERDVEGAIRAVPIAPVFNEEYGLYYSMPEFQRPQLRNPMAAVEVLDNTQVNRNYRAVGSVFAEVDFLQNFTFRTNLLADYGFNQNRAYTPIIDLYIPTASGDPQFQRVEQITRVQGSQDIYTKVQSDWLLTYRNSFGDHNLTATAGFTSYYDSFEQIEAGRTQGQGAPIPNDPRFNYVGMGSVDSQTGNGTAWERATLSYLLRGLYNYQGKYLLNASFRRDGSSAFRSSGNRYQNFGSVGAAWVISEENFMEPLEFVNNLKLKGSYGVLGSQNTGTGDNENRYPAFPILLANSSAVFGNNIYPAYEPEYIADDNLRWESIRSWEVGLELNAFNNRLYVEGAYYDKDTRDMLVTVPGILGTRPGLANVGSIRNSGIELAASWDQKLDEDWSYNISGNITTINNRVISLAGEGYQIFDGISRTTAGYPIGYFFGYEMDGVYQNQAEIDAMPNRINTAAPGDIRFRDVNGDGEITEADRTVIGNPSPDFTYGFSGRVRYKQFDLAAEFMGVYGNEIFRDWNRQSYTQFNFQEHQLGRWTGEGSTNSEPILNDGRPNNQLVSSYYIEDGSFIRIRNLQLGYNFSQELLSRLNLKGLRIYINAQNPFTWANSTGFTPEIQGDPISFGVDGGTYPIPAVYTMGLNLNF